MQQVFMPKENISFTKIYIHISREISIFMSSGNYAAPSYRKLQQFDFSILFTIDIYLCCQYSPDATSELQSKCASWKLQRHDVLYLAMCGALSCSIIQKQFATIYQNNDQKLLAYIAIHSYRNEICKCFIPMDKNYST